LTFSLRQGLEVSTRTCGESAWLGVVTKGLGFVEILRRDTMRFHHNGLWIRDSRAFASRSSVEPECACCKYQGNVRDTWSRSMTKELASTMLQKSFYDIGNIRRGCSFCGWYERSHSKVKEDLDNSTCTEASRLWLLFWSDTLV